MSRSAVLSPLVLGAATVAGVCGLAVSLWGLGALARPAGFETRMKAVDAQLAEIERLSSTKPAVQFGDGALCHGATLLAAQGLKDALASQASTAGVSLQRATVSPSVAAGAPGRLAAMDVSLSAAGPYDAVRKLLIGFEASRPEIFIDSLEIRPAAEGVTLTASGRAFCWTGGR